MKQRLIKEFERTFHKKPEQLYFCPGRVNLIGEHIDYNGGRVMPAAVSQGTFLALGRNTDKQFRFRSLDFPETADLHLQAGYTKTGKQWFNYPLGVINWFLEQGHSLAGLDMLFTGDLPVGAGLSSSASIEVLTAFALNDLFGHQLPGTTLATLSKNVENVFMGLNCGIMDQFAVAMGRKQHAILLNCDTLEYEYIPINTGSYELVIINSNKKRELVGSKYNERFAECALALTMLKDGLQKENLCDYSLAEFEKYRHLIADDRIEKRALHAISENTRVIDAAMAMQTGDMQTFGKILYASHHSLKVDYEVSCDELDTIIDFCKTISGCIGARMTGAGFGGCAIALVEKNRVGDFSEKLGQHYLDKVGYEAGIFVTEIVDAVGRLVE